MIIKMTKGKLLDITAIAFLLSFMLGISFSNMGEYPYEEQVEMSNLLASGIYVFFVVLFIWLSHFLNRKRLMIFNAVIFTLAFLFSIWYMCAAASTAFIPSSLAGIFSLFTYAFHTQFIGIYYLIDPIDRVIYGSSVCFISFAIAALSWCLLLHKYGYFEELSKRFPKKEKSERISRTEKMRREIKTERAQRASGKEARK